MRINCFLAVPILACLLGVSAVHAEQAVAIVPNNTLLLFDTATPSTTTARMVTGLASGTEVIRGIDYRPFTGDLFISTVPAGIAANALIRTYRLDSTTGAATFVGSIPNIVPGAADVPGGYDFRPGGIDRIRYVNVNNENARFNPNNGSLSGDDTNLTPPVTTAIIGAAYDRDSPAPLSTLTLTTLYVIDRYNSVLAILGGIDGTPSPNGGVVTDLAPLGFTLHPTKDGGFDISPSGAAYAALTDAGTGLTALYSLTLPTAVTATPAASLIGLIGTGTIEVYSLTILPPDTDGDGVRDPLDACPGDPLKTSPGICGCGVADTDSDGDGTADCIDECPNEPAKILAGSCGCGVADTDADGNGTPDCLENRGLTCGACGVGAATSVPLVAFMLALRRRRWTR